MRIVQTLDPPETFEVPDMIVIPATKEPMTCTHKVTARGIRRYCQCIATIYVPTKAKRGVWRCPRHAKPKQ